VNWWELNKQLFQGISVLRATRENLVYLIPLVLIAAFSFAIRTVNLEAVLDRLTDSDLYLTTAMLVYKGFPLYKEVFCSQPPLIIWLILLAFRLFGMTSFAGGLVGVSFSILGIVGVFLIAKEISGWRAGLVAALLLSFSPYYLWLSRSASNEIIFCALSMVAVYPFLVYLRNGDHRWLCGSGFIFGLCILAKFFAFFPLILVAAYLAWKRDARGICFFAISAVLPLLSLLTVDFRAMVDNTIIYQLKKPPHTWWTKLHVTQEFLVSDPSLMLAGFVGILYAFRRRDWRLWFVPLWFLIFFVGLILQSEFWFHYLINVLPPLAVLAGFILDQTLFKHPPKAIGIIVLIGLVLGASTVANQDYHYIYSFPRVYGPYSDTYSTATLVQSLTSPDDFIISGDLLIPFLSNRPIPPFLTDISWARIQMGLVSSAMLIQACQAYDIRVVVKCGRIDYFSDFIKYLHVHYERVAVIGSYWVYLRK